MGVFSKPFDLIEIKDVTELVTNQEREDLHLDYKQDINNTVEGKKKLVSHSVGIANSEGGYIIFGISENDDGSLKSVDGIAAQVGKQKVEEWLENVIVPHVSPSVIMRVKTLPLSKDKVVTVLWLPQSVRKPHMSTYEKDFRYYKRHNTQTLPASEIEVRDMYYNAGRINDAFEKFLEERNLLKVNSESFGLNNNSKLIPMQEKQLSTMAIPFVLFSACPRFLEERVDITSNSFLNWASKESVISLNDHNLQLVRLERSTLGINSVTFDFPTPRDAILEYLEINRNGFVEAGFGYGMIRASNNREKLGINLGRMTIGFWAFLEFVQKLYRRLNYLDEFSVFLSIRNADSLVPYGFYGIDGKNRQQYACMYDDSFEFSLGSEPLGPGVVQVSSYTVITPSQCKDKNIQHKTSLLMNEIDGTKEENTVKEFSARIFNAFGLQKPYCYNDNDGRLSKVHLKRYNSRF